LYVHSNYDNENLSKYDTTKIKYYALQMALDAKRTNNTQLVSLLSAQIKNSNPDIIKAMVNELKLARPEALILIGGTSGVDNANVYLSIPTEINKTKGINAISADEWTQNYINKWWSPAAKASYTKGTSTYNSKVAIYNSASKRYDNLV
jgi:hypothetical protein